MINRVAPRVLTRAQIEGVDECTMCGMPPNTALVTCDCDWDFADFRASCLFTYDAQQTEIKKLKNEIESMRHRHEKL